MGNFAYAYRRMIDKGPSNVISWTFFVLLWPFSCLYRGIVKLRACLYRCGALKAYQAAVPVVSVGNLTVGGTGKTPVVDAVVKNLAARGIRVAVVSRGYGGRFAGSVGVVATGDGGLLMSPRDSGDEPLLLAKRNPSLAVYVARKRVLGVRAAEEAGAQVIILDDGFQHLPVRRNLDIVLLDARAPFGNGQLLPVGPLREAPGALRRADLVIMTHAEQPPNREIPFAGPILHCRPRLADTLMTLDGQKLSWASLDGHPVLAFAGIARPDDFFAAVRAKGVFLEETLALNDHQEYSAGQLNRLIQSCDNQKFLITTEKDGVKLRTADLPCPCLVAPLVLDFDESSRLDEILTHLLKGVS